MNEAPLTTQISFIVLIRATIELIYVLFRALRVWSARPCACTSRLFVRFLIKAMRTSESVRHHYWNGMHPLSRIAGRFSTNSCLVRWKSPSAEGGLIGS